MPRIHVHIHDAATTHDPQRGTFTSGRGMTGGTRAVTAPYRQTDKLTAAGERVLKHFQEEYGNEKGREYFYASWNAGSIPEKLRNPDSAARVTDAEVRDIIRKVGGQYRLVSHTGKNLGTYGSRAGAEKRERQVEYFKHKSGDYGTPEGARKAAQTRKSGGHPEDYSQNARYHYMMAGRHQQHTGPLHREAERAHNAAGQEYATAHVHRSARHAELAALRARQAMAATRRAGANFIT